MIPKSPVIAGLEEYEIKIAEHQDEYQTLPALPIDSGQRVITRWHLGFRERLKALFTGNVYLHVYTFSQALQPLFMEVDKPELLVENRMTKEIPAGWHDDVSSPEAHAEAMDDLDELQKTGEMEVRHA